MSSGGARNRSGRAISALSEAGLRLSALPAEGYQGKPPRWPLTRPTTRERAVWRQLWKTPQACAWALPSESWRQITVAMYVRTLVRCEDPEAPASLLAQLHRFADQIGLTTAGLSEMGWKVAVDEVGQARAAKDTAVEQAEPPQRRPRVVSDAG